MQAIVLSILFLLCYFVMVNCCFLVNTPAINFVIIAMVFVLHETKFIFLNFVLVNISLKNSSNLS